MDISPATSSPSFQHNLNRFKTTTLLHALSKGISNMNEKYKRLCVCILTQLCTQEINKTFKIKYKSTHNL